MRAPLSTLTHRNIARIFSSLLGSLLDIHKLIHIDEDQNANVSVLLIETKMFPKTKQNNYPRRFQTTHGFQFSLNHCRHLECSGLSQNKMAAHCAPNSLIWREKGVLR